jgi:hypothetical protein
LQFIHGINITREKVLIWSAFVTPPAAVVTARHLVLIDHVICCLIGEKEIRDIAQLASNPLIFTGYTYI